ncbi:hypothetical protein FOL47_006446 [Perkinsus chesapeaki]|uniref:Uncharacterized protein n=1 Tax=Perkinsus chesapeaki TaxID=330153 RepID=A0A7J6MYM3_PERCH|nr:hypothetical protein FOL47_006446 [Perkinsus chesapeaki]
MPTTRLLRESIKEKILEGAHGYCVFSKAAILDFGVIRAHSEVSMEVEVHNPTARRSLVRMVADNCEETLEAQKANDQECFQRLAACSVADIEKMNPDDMLKYKTGATEEIDFSYLEKEDHRVTATFNTCARCECTAEASRSVQAGSSLYVTPQVALVEPGDTFLHLRPFGWWQKKNGEETLVQSIEVEAEVNPVMLSTKQLAWDKAYAGVESDPQTIVLHNPTDLPTSFEWSPSGGGRQKATVTGNIHGEIPWTDSSSVTIVPKDSLVKADKAPQLASRTYEPTSKSLLSSAKLICPDAIYNDIIEISATAFGPSIEMTVIGAEDVMQGGDGPHDKVELNFSSVSLLTEKRLLLEVKNTSGIAMALKTNVVKYRKLELPVPTSREELSPASDSCPRMLLDDVHERAKPRGMPPTFPRDGLLQAGMDLYSVIISPACTTLHPFATTNIECNVRSTVAFELSDELSLRIDKMPEFRVPLICHFKGCPLSIPPRQVAVDDEASPKLLDMSQLAFKQGTSLRNLLIKNDSNCAVRLTWHASTTEAIERHIGRHTLVAGERGVSSTGQAKPADQLVDSQDIFPIVVNPPELLIPARGCSRFIITMQGGRMGIQKYRLVGTGIYHVESADSVREREEAERHRQSMKRLIELTAEEEVRRLGPDFTANQTDGDSGDAELGLEGSSYTLQWAQASAFINGMDAGSITVDISAEVIRPTLQVDKKADKDGRKRFQFFHHPNVGGEPDRPWGTVPSPRAYRLHNRIYRRSVCYSNTSKTPIVCRFRCATTSGPPGCEYFRIRLIDVRRTRPRWSGDSDSSSSEFYKIWPQESATVTVEFIPPDLEDLRLHLERPALEKRIEEITEKWKPVVNVVGSLTVEYPGDDDALTPTCEEHVELVGVCTLPDLSLDIVEEYHNEPPLVISPDVYCSPFKVPPIVVDFGIRNVHSIVENVRELVLSAKNFVPCMWKMERLSSDTLKQGLSGKSRLSMAEQEILRSADDSSVFSIHPATEGIVYGPSVPFRKLPLAAKCVGESLMPRARNHADSAKYEPQRIRISFMPKDAIFYRSVFRIECLHGGRTGDVVLQGCGSFDEQDDLRVDAGKKPFPA